MIDVSIFTSPIGLGHATRDSALAQNLESFSKKFVTGDVASKFLKQYGFDVTDAYIPPKFKVKNGKLQQPLKWLWDYYQYYKECKKISLEFIKKENPRIVLSDEDFASLVIAQEKSIPSVLITDVLETEFTNGFGKIIEKKMNKSMKKIIDNCDAVIIPEVGENVDNIKRIGPIVRKTNFSREQLREKFGFDRKTIVLSVGGTDAGKFLIEKILNIEFIIDETKLVIVSGPSLKINSKKNIENFGFVNNLHELIYAADLVISLAGKSTIDESEHYGTPGIFIPLKGHFEQEDNAKQKGFSYDDINRLEILIPKKLEERRNPKNYDGDKKAAEIIKKFLSN